ncbi:MAG: NAD(P)/FAD-dependent oxidoreductase [Chromatiales bacterium]|nr:NAD(P)/FAD-dependent oxidoreductase [Chromatiales bacterium]
MTETNNHFDLAVIGSGPGGYRAAILAALRGLSVAIIEKADWGGCCLNRGCVPKKDWYHTARLVAASRHFAGRGISGELAADMDKAWDHQEAVVKTVQESYVDYMKRLKVTSFEGHGRFVDATTIAIDGQDGTREIHAKHSIIATGGTAYIPEGFEAVPGKVLTSDMLFDERPPSGKRVAIIGSGVIATEFAYIFSLLGKEVVWLARSPMLRKLPFSPQAMGTLRSALETHGIELRQGCRFESIDTSGEGVTIHRGDGETVEVDWVCLGTGRVPHTEGLDLENAGVETDARGFVKRNDQLQTAAGNIYAIGDVASDWMTANHALSDATVAVDNIIDGNTRKQDGLWVPLVVYSAVELARLGMDEDMAEDEELEPAVGFAAFETNPRAMGQDETEGFVRLIGDMDSGALLGGEIIGADAGEIIHLLSLAPDRHTALKWLASGTYNHPARAEELLNATETLASKWGLADEIFG